ncbi:GntR family transcriptional regulator [Sphingomonas sp. Root710]|uniref:GntR family transcriptional regulator n=1 Tax=Sphingomonas sp. Root710 TaxID=1736594 RepID=UPI0009EC96D2|nr:FCD domain-containing protein [Sphingomonas sp. Root710]
MLSQNQDNLLSFAEEPRSQATFAYEVIRSDILSGRHAPDTKLKIQLLANELNVSPGAVREALSRLVPERLVLSRDQRGFVVAPLSVNDLEDLTDLRCEVEAIALRRSVNNGDVAWEGRILAAEHCLRSEIHPDSSPRQAWAHNHAMFHAALVSACGSPRLLALHASLYEQSERYRGLTYKTGFSPKRNVDNEHRKIVKKALTRDADGLVDAVTSHFKETTRLIIDAFGKNG